jgi:hypothetical protein
LIPQISVIKKPKGDVMTEKLGSQQTIDFKELLIAEMIEIDTIRELLIEKGIIDRNEYFSKLKAVQSEYEKRRRR